MNTPNNATRQITDIKGSFLIIQLTMAQGKDHHHVMDARILQRLSRTPQYPVVTRYPQRSISILKSDKMTPI